MTVAAVRALCLFVAGSITAQHGVESDFLRVTVLDRAGKPAEGAVVEVLRFEGGDALYSNLDLDEKGEHRTLVKMPTPRNGSLGLQVPVAIPFRVRVDLAPHAIEVRAGVYAGEELTIRLREAATVEGLVRDDSGRPLAAEHVTLLTKKHPRAASYRTKASAEGRFRFERMMPGEVYVSAESTQASVHHGQPVRLAEGETKKLEFTLERGGTMRGKVLDAATGKPIAGARIGVGWTLDKPVYSAEDGSYELVGLGGPFSNNLYVSKQGYCELQIDRPRERQGVVDRDLKLHRGFAVSGRILDEHGKPVAGCYVAAVGMTHGGNRQETDWRSVRTDAEGRFEIPDLRKELSPVLLVRRDRYATTCLAIPAPGDRSAVTVEDFRLRPRRIVQGVLLDADGSPVVGQLVKLDGCHREAPKQVQPGRGLTGILGSYLGERETYTDSLGRFFFGDLGPGTYTLKTVTFERQVEVGDEGDPAPIELRK